MSRNKVTKRVVVKCTKISLSLIYVSIIILELFVSFISVLVKMAEKSNYPTQHQQPGMYYPQETAPNPNVPMYPPNDMNQMSAPPTYDQATQPYVQPR